jgi:hypothetical protein
MKLTKSKLRKLVVEEISQQTKKAELTKEGLIDTIKSAFGGKKEEILPAVKSFEEFEKICNDRQQQYEKALNDHFNDFSTKVRIGTLKGRVSLTRVSPQSDTVYAIGFGESFKALLAPKNFMDEQPPNEPKSAYGWAYHYEDKNELGKAQAIGKAFVEFWNECVDSFQTIHDAKQKREGVTEVLGKKMKKISLNMDKPSHTILEFAGGDQSAPLVILNLESAAKKESLHNDGKIIAERWQRLAGLIK